MVEGKTTEDNTKNKGEEAHVMEAHATGDLPSHRSGTLGTIEELAQIMDGRVQGRGEMGPSPRSSSHHPGTPRAMEETAWILDGMRQGGGKANH